MADTVGRETAFLAGGTELGALMRAHDWTLSPLGQPETWPAPLRASVSLMLGSAFPMFLAWGPDLGFLYNDAYVQILGSRHPAGLGCAFRDVWPEIWSDIEPIVRRALDGEASYMEDMPLRMARNGFDEQTWFTFSYSPLRGEDGTVAGMFCACTETTRRVHTETALRQRERELGEMVREFQALAENVSQLAWMAEPDGHIFWYNRRWYEYTGTTLEVMQGWGWRDVHLPDQIERIIAEVGGRWAAGEAWEGVYHLRSATGEYRPFLTRAEPIRNEAGELVRWFGTNTDISAQHAAERGLRDLNVTLEAQVRARTTELQLSRDMIQSNADPICAFDTDYRLIDFNRAHSDEFYRIFGRRVALGDVFPDLFPPDQAPIMRGLMARALTGEAYTVTEEFGDPRLAKPRWEVSYSPLRDEQGRVIGAFHYARDISARLRAEAELAVTQEALRQAQKMEAVGQLTGGLAHDFNNLLAGISGSLEMMQSRMQQGRFHDIERYMAAAQGASKRAAALTHRLLAFSRRQTLDPRPTDVNRLTLGMQELIQRTVGPGIAVEVVGASGVWPTLVDPSQLENALLNLCINARDAMPDGGTITIETSNKWLDERAARQQDVPEGQYLTLSVTDTGTGMPPEVVARVFEPFFTTKPIGEGTGLGLSMIYGFAQQSGGQVRIYSEVGTGTTVSIYLPRHYGEVPYGSDMVPAVALPRSEQGETVLVVDDEPTVRMLVTDILEDLGYTAIEAGDSAAGLRILQSNVRIDLLVSDVGLPGGMNGRQMADAARIARPDLKVLFITGYAENAVLGNSHLAPGMGVLTKPFAIETMAARIRSMIEAGREARR
ncbi:hypothetical protein ASF20_13260 [Methylobacterium sp. Leaf88]|nr:hypothetical protein ASF20_13260 [Methylobacterium sp. Leaf88]